jgi:ABC-type glycerol-3-phosphate transport system substrate-binding protein
MTEERVSKGKEISRRSYLKYAGAGVVVVAVAGAGAYYATQPTAPPPTPTSTTSAPAVTSTVVPTPTTESFIEKSRKRGPVKLVFAVVSGPRFEFAVRPIIDSFKKEYPWIDVELDVASMGEHSFVKVPTELASRQGNIDLFYMGYEQTMTYFLNGFTLDMTPYINHDEVGIRDRWDDFLQVPRESFTLTLPDGSGGWKEPQICAIPMDSNSQAMFYRPDILDSAGISVPKTWDDIVALNDKLWNPSAKTYGFAGALTSVFKTYSFCSHFEGAGGTFFNENWEPQFHTDAGTKALQEMIDVNKKIPPGALEWGEDDSENAIGNTGTIAVYADWGSPAPTSPKVSKLANKVKAGLFPGGRPLLGGLGLFINSASKHPDESWLLMEFLTRDENAETYMSSTGQPGRKSWLELGDKLGVAGNWYSALMDNINHAAAMPRIREFMGIWDLLLDPIALAMTGKQDIQTSLKAMDSSLYDFMGKQGYYKTGPWAYLYDAKKQICKETILSTQHSGAWE